MNRPLTIADYVHAACVMEATARKPGNVHPEASFADCCFDDFLRSASAISLPMEAADMQRVGQTILDAVRETQLVVGKNTNLGIILLIAPLATVPGDMSLKAGIGDILAGLDVRDAELVYEAIRLASPGGLGEAASEDVREQPTITLREAMSLAGDRDTIAAQYVNGFDAVLRSGLRSLASRDFLDDWEQTVIGLHLDLMAEYPDTLIARKCGVELAEESASRARDVLQRGWPEKDAGRRAIIEFDQWLRADGHRRNPGTTADLVAATLFAAFRERIEVPPATITLRGAPR